MSGTNADGNTYTTPETAQLVRANLHLSAMYSGEIAGVGPRYCPSIEDKFVRFATPAPQLMRQVALTLTVIGSLLLMYFLFAQKGFTPVQRFSFSGAMVLIYGTLGYAWLHPRVQGAAHV